MRVAYSTDSSGGSSGSTGGLSVVRGSTRASLDPQEASSSGATGPSANGKVRATFGRAAECEVKLMRSRSVLEVVATVVAGIVIIGTSAWTINEVGEKQPRHFQNDRTH